MGDSWFFYPGLDKNIRLNNTVIDCYRLAKYYGRNPREFLAMDTEEVAQHMAFTEMLLEMTEPPSAR